MNLKEETKVLLFGKPRAFSEEEFAAQMKYHKIEVVKEFSDDVSSVVDGRMMTPNEQEQSAELYKTKAIQSISINVLEEELAKFIDDATLLMSLKLSHDKERLKSFIQNSCISDALFFKLVKMYSWSGEDFFENDDNRDVSAAFISRFYENIERNHNVQYATTGFIHLVNQAKSATLLKAISELEPMQFHPKIKVAIAMSIYIDEFMQEAFFKKGDERTLEGLSCNKKLKTSLLKELLNDASLALNIARNVELDDAKFALLSDYSEALSENESLSTEMQKSLFSLHKDEVNLALASNDNLDIKIINLLLESDNEALNVALYKNAAMPVRLLEEAYTKGCYFASLARNENTPVDILYQLQLDSRYERAVKTNAGFGKHIQSENIGWMV